jgi:two-component system sensor histidine kinase AlgZ
MAQDAQMNRSFLPDFCTGQSVIVLVVAAELLAVVMSLIASLYEHVSALDFAMLSIFIQWVALSSAAILCILSKRLRAMPRAMAASLVGLLVVLDTFLFSLAARAIMDWFVVGAADPSYRIWSNEVLIHSTIAAILAGVVMRYFYVQEQLRIKDEAELQSRIQALQSRIRPHFLFNSMNIIASLIAVDPKTAEEVVEDLSRLFRASLREAGDEVNLGHELELCRRYIRIEQLRMGERLKVEWQIHVDPETIRIPLLTLQPLLENAIYHGIQPLNEGGTVQVSVRNEGEDIVLRVGNPIPDRESQHRGNRMALENIRHRLEALYGRQASVASGAKDGHYEVVISYPLAK